MIPKIKEKKNWISPQIKKIVLDNEISLQLASNKQPTGEPDGEEWAKAGQPLNSEPYKMG